MRLILASPQLLLLLLAYATAQLSVSTAHKTSKLQVLIRRCPSTPPLTVERDTGVTMPRLGWLLPADNPLSD